VHLASFILLLSVCWVCSSSDTCILVPSYCYSHIAPCLLSLFLLRYVHLASFILLLSYRALFVESVPPQIRASCFLHTVTLISRPVCLACSSSDTCILLPSHCYSHIAPCLFRLFLLRYAHLASFILWLSYRALFADRGPKWFVILAPDDRREKWSSWLSENGQEMWRALRKSDTMPHSPPRKKFSAMRNQRITSWA
jgi:hypothetical protein